MKTPLQFDQSELQKFKQFLSDKPRTLIVLHAGPDGDTTGSSLALFSALQSYGVSVDLVCKDALSADFGFLENSEKVAHDFDEKAYGAVFFMDCGDKRMTRFHEEKPRILSDDILKINIDHHPTNDHFGNINFVFPEAASSTQIVYELLSALQCDITPQMATALLLGLYTDTGAFMHQNTTPEVYRVAGDLVALGGNMSRISKNIFRSYRFRTLKLWGKVLQSLSVTPDGAAIVGIPKNNYLELGATREDLTGVVDYINAMPEAQYTVLLSEDEKGNVKASLRTRKETVDVKALAEKFGGGGHVKASGFMVKGGHLEKEVTWKIVKE